MSSSEIRVEVDDAGVAVLTLDRPPVNAMGRSIREAFLDAMDRLGAEPAVRAIVLTGAGHVFCAGADIKEKAQIAAQDYARANRLTRDSFLALLESPKPVIAAVNGGALGAGLVMAACCDIILAADTAFFSMPEIDVGQGGGASVLQRIMPPGKMRRMMLTGERVPAAEFHRLGIVEEVLPADRLLPRAVELAATIAAKSPSAVMANSRQLRDGGTSADVRRLPGGTGLYNPAQHQRRSRRDAASLRRQGKDQVGMSKQHQASGRWSRRPEGSNWGDFGPDDQRGRLNLLTPERLRAAVTEVKEGLAFCLSMPLDRPGGNLLSPSRVPPVLRPTLKNGMARVNYPVSHDIPGAPDLICDDAAVLHTQYSTHWDALSHTGFMFDADGDGIPEKRYYNGYSGDDDIEGSTDAAQGGSIGTFEAVNTIRAKRLGIENLAESCVQGRGVMLDLHAHFGREPVVVGWDDLSRILAADRVEVQPGDMLCLHTGFAEVMLEADGAPTAAAAATCATLDGSDKRLQDWITDSGLSVIAADNFAVESWPARNRAPDGPVAPLHELCLFRLGIHLGELWQLSPLARWLRAHGRNRFLLTAPPLRLPGATGSPVTPVATV